MSDRMQKLEALLERVRRNKTLAPMRTVAAATAAPLALEALSPAVAAPVAVAPVPLTPAPAPVTPITPPVTPVPDAHLEAPAPVTTKTEPPPPPATPSWQPEPGSAVQARPSTVPPMEISDDDLLDVTTIPPQVAPPSSAARSQSVEDDEDIDVDVEEEKAPVSSSRFKVPGTLDEALANAAQLEGEREIPIKTPPPESGPQEALPVSGLDAPGVPDMDQLEADLMPPPSMGPTAEQLGETIELEPPRGPELEIDVASAEADPITEPPPEELEVTLPRASLPSGLYDVNITAPPPEPVVTLEAPAPQGREAVTVPARTHDEGPERTARPALGATDVAGVTLPTPAQPKTFVELLDAALSV